MHSQRKLSKNVMVKLDAHERVAREEYILWLGEIRGSDCYDGRCRKYW